MRDADCSAVFFYCGRFPKFQKIIEVVYLSKSNADNILLPFYYCRRFPKFLGNVFGGCNGCGAKAPGSDSPSDAGAWARAEGVCIESYASQVHVTRRVLTRMRDKGLGGYGLQWMIWIFKYSNDLFGEWIFTPSNFAGLAFICHSLGSNVEISTSVCSLISLVLNMDNGYMHSCQILALLWYFEQCLYKFKWFSLLTICWFLQVRLGLSHSNIFEYSNVQMDEWGIFECLKTAHSLQALAMTTLYPI